jgi:hypothetical protein
MEHPVDPNLPEYEPGEPHYASLDEVLHEIHAEHGPEALREVLLMVEIGREDLEDCAAALEAAGKPSIAAIVREIAAEARSGIDVDDPYEPGSLNSRFWRHSWRRKRWVASGEMEKSLRQRQASRQASQARKH